MPDKVHAPEQLETVDRTLTLLKWTGICLALISSLALFVFWLASL